MKLYRQIMRIVLMVENTVLALSVLLVLLLTFGNVVARKLFQHSWGFTEEIVVAVFVLISLLGAGTAAREEGGLVNLSLLTDHVNSKTKKILHVISSLFCIIYSFILCFEAISRMVNDKTSSPILGIPKSFFWGFVVIGAISLILHFIENCIDYNAKNKEEAAS